MFRLLLVTLTRIVIFLEGERLDAISKIENKGFWLQQCNFRPTRDSLLILQILTTVYLLLGEQGFDDFYMSEKIFNASMSGWDY